MGELEPEIHASDLPPDVTVRRLGAASMLLRAEAYWAPRITAHLDTYDGVIDSLIAVHTRIADETDVAIGADTRWSAIWEMGGRCLSIARVVLHDARGGFASEADGSLRALHEATQLLSAIAYHDEEDVVRRWLAGEWVRPREARDVQKRQAELAAERMRDACVEPVAGDIAELGKAIYSTLSESSHHQRTGFPESVSRDLRKFAYGPHPDAERRAGRIAFIGELIEEVVLVVGASLGEIVGGDVWADLIRPLQERLVDARNAVPLPE